MRLFVAIFPDDRTRAYLRDFRTLLVKYKRNFKFTPIDQLHLTIKFLGANVSEKVFEYYTNAFAEKLQTFKKFEYELERPSFGFAAQITPSILMSPVKSNEIINDITYLATQSAKSLGWQNIITKQEHKKLIHHITLARRKSDMSKAFARELRPFLETLPAPDFKSFASSITIVESTLTDTGPLYKPLKSIELG